MTIEIMKQALEALEMLARYENPETRIQVRKPKDGGPIVTMYPHKVATDAADALRTAIEQAEKQEPVAWKWHQAPVRTSWGHDMVVADLAIDKDNTVSVYCERDQTAKVEAMFTPPAANRPWVGLTEEEILSDDILRYYYGMNGGAGPVSQKGKKVVAAIEAKLKEKNNG
jgi:hypothetical protein